MTKAKTRVVVINEKEVQLIDAVLEGKGPTEAYKEIYKNSYTDTKCKYQANLILKKECVVEYMSTALLDREKSVVLDEPFVIELLKDIAISCKKDNPNTAVRAAELLGKTMAMFSDKQVLDTTTGHREMSDKIWKMREDIEAGIEPEPIEKVEDKTQIIEFKVKTGTDDD